jgi:hypothetical protein
LQYEIHHRGQILCNTIEGLTDRIQTIIIVRIDMTASVTVFVVRSYRQVGWSRRRRRGFELDALLAGTDAVVYVAQAAAAVIEGVAPPAATPSRWTTSPTGGRPRSCCPGWAGRCLSSGADAGADCRGGGARYVARDLLAHNPFLDTAERSHPLGLVPRSVLGTIRATVDAAYRQP